VGIRRDDAPAAQPALPVPRELAAGLAGLTGAAGLILDYLAHRGHATTAEPMALIGVEAEDVLLLHLHEDFRQVETALGGPAIRYDGVYFDRRPAVVRHQSWRLGETVAEGWLASRVPTEVLVEEDELLVVTSVPTQARGALSTASVDTDGRGLVLRGAGGQDRWIALPEEVTGQAHCAVTTTGTLVIRARRKARAAARMGNGTAGRGRANPAAATGGDGHHGQFEG
jgi:hypothetical protein